MLRDEQVEVAYSINFFIFFRDLIFVFARGEEATGESDVVIFDSGDGVDEVSANIDELFGVTFVVLVG